MKTNETLTIQEWPTSDVDPFPFQARKHFREAGLEELCASVKEHGILQPMLGRPCATNRQRVELIAGERRLRAAKLAGRPTVPIIVREISDADAEEMMLTENLQREDLSAVEEADALWRMLQIKNDDGELRYTLASLAAKLGKSDFVIRQAVKLRGAPEALLTAVEKGDVPVSVAAAVGRIPDAKARERATKEILTPATQPVPLNYEQAVQKIRSDFMARIPGAGFDAKDSSLVPMKKEAGERVFGGACEDCPFRSGNIVDIADMLQGATASSVGGKKSGTTAGVDPQLCTKPSCLNAKQDAQWERVKGDHLKDGGRVLTAEEAKKEFSSWQGKLRYDSPYALMTDEPEYSVFQRAVEGTWKAVTEGLAVTVVLARHPETRKVMKLVVVKEAAELLRKKWKMGQETDGGVDVEEEKRKEQRAQELLKEKAERRHWRLVLSEILERVAAKGLGLEEMPVLFKLVLDHAAGADGMTVMGQWLDIKLPKGGQHSGRSYEEPILEMAGAQATTVNAWMAWMMIASLSHTVKWGGAEAKDVTRVLEMIGSDPKALKRLAMDQVKAELAEKVKPKKDKGKGKGKEKEPENEKMDAAREADLTAAADERNKLPVGTDETVAMQAQVMRIVKGANYVDVLGKTPKKGTDEHKVWEAARVKLVRAVKRHLEGTAAKN